MFDEIFVACWELSRSPMEATKLLSELGFEMSLEECLTIADDFWSQGVKLKPYPPQIRLIPAHSGVLQF